MRRQPWSSRMRLVNVDVLVGVGRPALRARSRPAGTPLATATAFITSASRSVNTKPDEKITARRIAGAVQIDRLRDALLEAAAGLARLADAAGEHDDGVRGRGGADTSAAARLATTPRGVEDQQVDRPRSADDRLHGPAPRARDTGARSRSSHPAARSPLARSAASSISADIAAMRAVPAVRLAPPRCGARSPPAATGGVSVRGSRRRTRRRPRRRSHDRRRARALKRRISARSVGDHRNPHHQVFVQLRRIDVRGVVGDAVRHQADVEPAHVARQLGVRPLAEQVHVRAAPSAARRRLAPADQRERHVAAAARATAATSS